MKKIKLLIACGSGIATSSMAEMKLIDEFKRRGVPVETFKCSSFDILSHISLTNPDIIVTTAVIDKKNLKSDTPVFTGVPILYGDPSEVYDNIFEEVKRIQSANASHE